MRFAISRACGSAIFGVYGWLLYTAFKARALFVLVCSIFFGAILLRASTNPVFDWGEGRGWDGRCRYALIVGGILAASAVGAAIWLSPAAS